MNPNHIPAFGEEYSQMVAVQKMERCDIAKVIKAQMAVAARFNGSGPWAGIERIEDVTLVLVSGLKPAHREVVRLVQVPLYFAEVCNYVALPQDALDQRLQFALETGYVPYGRDEAVAVMIAGDNNYVFTHVYEVNPEGEARSKAGFFDHTEKRWSQLRHIKNLNRTETERELGEVRGDLLWWSGKRGFGDVQEQRQRLTLMLLEKHLEVAQPERTSSGAIIKRSFIENGSVESTAHLRQPSKGWRSYPTSQDAWYFGVFWNPLTMETLTYAEQDVSHVICETQEQFFAELANMADFYGNDRQPCAVGFDNNVRMNFYDTLYLMPSQGRKEIVFDLSKKGVPDKQPSAPVAAAICLTHPVFQDLDKAAFTPLPREAFELDMLNPQAFKAYEAFARQGPTGIEFVLQMAGGKNLQTVYGPVEQGQPA